MNKEPDLKQNRNNIATKRKYKAASFWVRLFARSCDILFISTVSFAFSFLFFINSDFTINEFFSKWNGNETIQGWRILLMMIFLLIINFIYFVLIPTYWKGQTLFKWIFKIRFVSEDPNKNFFLLVFRHEALIWMPLIIFNIIVGIICVCVPSPIKLFQQVFDFSIQTTNTPQTSQQVMYVYLAVFIKTLYALGGIVPACLLLYMVAFRKKRAIQDTISYGYVVYSKNTDINKNPKHQDWYKFLYKKQLAQYQAYQNEKQQKQAHEHFEPFIDHEQSKYQTRKEAVKLLKQHTLIDDLPDAEQQKELKQALDNIQNNKRKIDENFHTTSSETWYNER